jgi:hypothetical protein
MYARIDYKLRRGLERHGASSESWAVMLDSVRGGDWHFVEVSKL